MQFRRFISKDLELKKKNIFSIGILTALLFLILNLKSLLLFIPFVFADQTISTTILPRTIDYQFSLARADGQTTIGPGLMYSYNITYGAKQSTTFPTSNTIITVSWANTAPNNTSMLEYVYGSATDGYHNVPPLIDTTNDTLTWIIPSLPPGTTDQKLTFSLYSNGNYTGSNAVISTIKATMQNQYVTLPEHLLMQTYRYTSPPPGPTSNQPTSAPPAAPTPVPSITPSPHVRMTNFSMNTLSDNNATVQVATSQPVKISAVYGTSPTALTKRITLNGYHSLNSIMLPNLSGQTTYYIQITGVASTGQSFTSEIFTFKTARISTIPSLDNNVITVVSNDLVLFSGTQHLGIKTSPAVILTQNSPYEITYAISAPFQVKTIDAVVQNKVLGISTMAESLMENPLVIPMQLESRNLYVADLKTITPGSYNVYIRLADTNGNIMQKKIADLKVIPRFTVYASDTRRPLADARIFLSYYDTQTNNYQPITPALFNSINNPSYTDSFGQSPITLPPGVYQVEESALFYDPVKTYFIIGLGSNQDFPVMYLKRDPYNLISFGNFTKNYLSDTWDKIAIMLHEFSISIRIFHLISVTILSSFVIVGLLLFLLRTHIHVKHLPIFFLFHLHWLFGGHKQKYIFGTISDKDGRPVSNARIEVEDKNTSNIVLQTVTNKSGKFYFRNTFPGAITLLITKEGFEVTTIDLEKDPELPDTGLNVLLEKGEAHHQSFLTLLVKGIGDILGLLFEVSIVLSFIIELLFMSVFGFEKTALYFVISFITILLWLFYLRERN